ncbi:5-oxoprolinase subunit B family protein [Nocardioides hwasunensis]|uniref:Allophanate hydrolase subunit 1 n=1 Tax=Nocardioides hwasunensis TaxID=397258 RepID=A0ABR8MER7_9ACTN|nr:allophanate hydrolase subunit 1 [Nocardioides hwasunensis]MBD3914593.1 allophanate hydrolase subunit 1 [Nocardioides hwasunensis]
MVVPRLVPVGTRACLVEVEDGPAAASLADWARRTGISAEEIVPAATTVLFDGVDLPGLEAALAGWTRGAVSEPGPAVTVPVTYDGPDLAAVAQHWRCTVEDVVRVHTSLELTAVFSGFAPGFSYLSGLPAERAVPRLATPRARVARGSVALADTWCGIYPSASPGGWLVIGSTDAVLWDADRDPPALLAPGTRVRFEEAG